MFSVISGYICRSITDCVKFLLPFSYLYISRAENVYQRMTPKLFLYFCVHFEESLKDELQWVLFYHLQKIIRQDFKII